MLDFVDPLIGTVNGGHVFPGANLPYGMAKPVADVNTEIQGGFASDDGDITGFSHMHDSGTGGGASLGNFPLFAQTGCEDDELNKCYFRKDQRASQRLHGSVEARPGYFAVTLNTSVKAEMTATNHTALYRFTFPPDASNNQSATKGGKPVVYSPLILADLTDLSDSRTRGSIAVDPDTGRITGNGTFRPSFGIGTYELHFCADFQGAEIRDTGVWRNTRAGSEPKNLETFEDGNNEDPPLPAGAYVQFHPPAGNQVLARVGLSFISAQQACSNAEREIQGFDFEDIRVDAEEAWRDKLGHVVVQSGGVDVSLQRLFWSGLYRTFISPQDYTGENPLWQSTEPYFDSYYCIWDSFRSTHPLLTLVDPHAQALMVRSLLDIYRHEGHLPDCRMALCKGFTQGGSNADNLLADSYLKGLKDGIDWELAYEAVVTDAEVEPALWTVQGRGGLHSWKTLGYIPTDDYDPYGTGLITRSISRTVEYSYNDFCIAALAKRMNKTGDAEKYLARSSYWQNMYDAQSRSLLNLTGSTSAGDLVDSGFSGFLQPRYQNGTVGFQDPSLCTPLFNFTSCYLNPGGHETYEGGSWLYTFYIPHDQATLIPVLGGVDTFVARLQYLHDTPGLLYIGNEQSYLLIFLFHFAGRPGLSSRYARKYIPGSFNDTLSGIPGNDDSGAMGSFTALTMMGLFPMSGQDVYLIIPPFFGEVSVRNDVSGNTATIRCLNFSNGSSGPEEDGNIFIQNAKLNGEPYTKSWVTHSFFLDGGVLELTLGANESTTWGTAQDDLPPSASTHFWED
ncbi:alpha-1,2-mannosidase, putative subfamily [Microdochium trichocladiopsis]|uniref:Alpha-1,2-mannosidase, putative subfamily n=1 Tax=Microdochium trichocladiopsis TaxID=1682393 RepID=A0A9P8YCK7_9PEZI|nr:alpha-1,2-mannosidase, putative subfamily [Microdochium trichocladiopsis]KAH7035797.1 alpha-1,2-mannosidase, putative subfamily [Microdochium trichocladiopsis]